MTHGSTTLGAGFKEYTGVHSNCALALVKDHERIYFNCADLREVLV